MSAGANVYSTAALTPLASLGIIPVITVRPPAVSDVLGPAGPFRPGQIWVDSTNDNSYILTSVSSLAGVVSATWTVAGTLSDLDTLTGDSGGAVSPAAGNINILGTSNEIGTSGAGDTITLALEGPHGFSTLTAHGVVIGEGASPMVATTPGTDGQVLTGATGADPTFTALGVRSGLTAHGVLLGEGVSAIVATTAGTNGEVLTGATGADPTFSALGVRSGLTAHGVLLGEGSSAIVATTAGTTGQVLIGSTGADPAFGALGVNSGLTAHGVLLGEANSAVVATTAGSNGQVLLGSTGADPAFGTLSSSGIEVMEIMDITPIPHNGCRPPKRRRV